MSLSALSPSRAGGPPPVGGDWGDSPYGSLITLGPRTFKKKPVLMLDAEELAKAHLAIAMGGAEIMETMPDPVEAPRPRQPAMLLGLAPMGVEEPEEDMSAYPAGAAESAVVEEEWDEPAEEEADVQTWVPEDEAEDVFDDYQPFDDTGLVVEEPAADLLPPVVPVAPPDMADAAPPSIEEQMQRMRERLARRAAAATPVAAPEPAAPPAVAEPRVPTIQRLEIDDWSQGESLKGFIPPQEADIAPAAPEPVRVPEPAAAPEQPVVQVPVVAPEPEPLFVAPVAPEPVATGPVRETPQWHDEPANLLDLNVDMVAEEDAALDAWQEHLQPVARRASPIRERLRASLTQPVMEDDIAPSLLARLWTWLRSRF